NVPPSVILQAPISGDIYLERAPSSLKLKNLQEQNNAYYLQVASDSNISSITSTSDAWSANAYTQCDKESYKCIAVSIDETKIHEYKNLSTVLVVKYANGNQTQLPLTANIVSSGSGMYMSLPQTIVPNQDGLAYGVMTVFNSGNTAESIGEVATGVHENATFEFAPNCDGNYGNIVESHSTCSLSFVYKATQKDVAIPNIAVQVPMTPVGSSTPVLRELNTSSVIPMTVESPNAVISYSGNGVSLSSSNTSTFTIQNIGNGPLSGVTVEGLPNGVNSSNTCSDIKSNATCSITLSKTGSVVFSSVVLKVKATGSNELSVPLFGKDLSVSPLSLDFGTSYAGTSINKVITVSNTSATQAISGLTIGSIANPSYVKSSTCASTLGALNSCQVTINYVAPNASGVQNSSLVVSDSAENITVNFSAMSLYSVWSNIITGSGTGYTDYNMDLNNPTVISAIGTYGSGNEIMFGNVNYGNDSAGRHVWAYNSSSQFSKYSYCSYCATPSVPTAISYADSNITLVGSWNGTLWSCTNGNSTCAEKTPMSPNKEFGVTSIVPLDSTHAIVAWAKPAAQANLGTPGQLLYWNGSSIESIAGIEYGVGKMTSDADKIYAPIYSNAFSVVAIDKINPNTIAVTNNVNSLESGEYFTVLYQNNGVLYAGTNFSNMYKTTLPLVSGSLWTKLNNSCLSGDCNEKEMPTMITGIIAYNNNLYVSLANPFELSDYGVLYKYYINNNVFVRDGGYTDTFGVTGMTITNNGKLYVSSASGSIYAL
ncbi:MAG: hypothetical protein PHC75_02930, partial [Burkholderiales bacterium]|nr:hypothetical protein [Burkholderiales bacterium]